MSFEVHGFSHAAQSSFAGSRTAANDADQTREVDVLPPNAQPPSAFTSTPSFQREMNERTLQLHKTFASSGDLLQRPCRSSPRTPPSSSHPPSAVGYPPTDLADSPPTPEWPSIVDILETPDRKRCRNQEFESTRQTADGRVPAETREGGSALNETADSGLGNSFLHSPPMKQPSAMFLRPSPVLRTPLSGPKTLNSPLRTFFFKASPSTNEPQPLSLTKSENSIGIRFSGAQLANLRSPRLLASFSNQSAAPSETSTPTTDDRAPAPTTANPQRSPLKPCNNGETSEFFSPNFAAANNNRRLITETPSKGIKGEGIYDDHGLFSPFKMGAYFNYNELFVDHSMMDAYPSTASAMDSSYASRTENSSHSSSSFRDQSSKDDSLSSFSLTLNSSDDSFSANTSAGSGSLPGNMSCTTAQRIKMPRISSRTRSLMFGKTAAQREMSRQAKHFWKRNCRPGYRTGIKLANSTEEFASIDWNTNGQIVASCVARPAREQLR
ncbi:hypothetical protein M3Y99_01269200 [Aphelenchoides fujianensis]|nr:hypothetical protein M3Y99_01269200 [Aphelenchoides fujianensis]